MSTDQHPPLVFTAEELDMLGRTADALSAYMGKPVLAEIIDAQETGFEWALFAVPLETGEDARDLVTVQVGGAGARIIGHQGGLQIADGDTYQCLYLWAIQLSDIEGVRFIKVDDEGEEVAWSDDLGSMLPFALSEAPLPPDDDLDMDLDDDPSGQPPTLH
ncbi:MAG TPA: hypothetical protein VL003_10580 [Pusillimonas sp.]|uniref:hypothetical protein n=1 Tax=Pusillimonas sp. TaxID=3040095 RepID=UPI002B8E56A4|nr:hypothetical protein [Pusillimonas sp.]HUH88476.1 hypothetical protein [Pusillimonas sp.]